MSSVVITISDGISLPKNIPSYFIAALYRDLTIKNPAYIEAKKFQRSTKSIPKHIKLFKETKEAICLPRGYLFLLIKRLKEEKIAYKFINETISSDVDYPEMNGSLRPYQNEAILKAYKYRQGVIISPCGSGKTVMGIFFLAMTGQKTLWITHTKDLMYQTIEQIEKFLSIPSREIGKIGDGKKVIGEKITVGLVQSLVKYNKDILREEFGAIIIDEAHRVPSKTFKDVVEISRAKFRLGLTATPKRKDGLEPILYHVVGQTVFEITEEDLIKENRILIPKVTKIFTNFRSKRTDFQGLMKQLITCRERNQLIVQSIKDTLGNSEVALLLSNRVEHCHTIAKLLNKEVRPLKIAVLTGKVSKDDRERVIEQARNNEINLIIATQLADEGLDIPNLNKLYLATPSKSKAKVKQQLGRIMRNVHAKQTPIVYDFVDVQVPIFRRHGNIRTIVYHELRCEIH